MLPARNKSKAPAGQTVAPEPAGLGLWTKAMNGAVARLGLTVRSLRLQRGFSLLESVAAVGVIGISVVGSVLLLGNTVRTADITQGDLGLVQLIRSQVETIQSAPYNDDPSQYPLITDIPSSVSITFEATDPGTRYQVDGADLGQVIQQIEVTGTKDEEKASLTFYKIKKE